MIPKRECTVCQQEWATTYEEFVGPCCQGCKGHLAWADSALTNRTGICAPPMWEALWWKQLRQRGEILVHQ